MVEFGEMGALSPPGHGKSKPGHGFPMPGHAFPMPGCVEEVVCGGGSVLRR